VILIKVAMMAFPQKTLWWNLPKDRKFVRRNKLKLFFIVDKNVFDEKMHYMRGQIN
jgi:hypothetical protein